MLFNRYGEPETLLSRYLEIGELARFVVEVVEIRNNDLLEQAQWEFYLHKVYDMSYDEYLRKTATSSTDSGDVDKQEVETTVKRSFDALERFNEVMKES